jgi:hypothetical protein
MSAKKPIPRNRKTKAGEESTVPPGFTFESYVDARGALQTGWRCAYLSQNPVTGEWQRCSKHMQKSGCASHLKSGNHEYHIPRANDPGFPVHFQEHRAAVRQQRGFNAIHNAMARFAGSANVSAREAAKPPLIGLVREVAAIAIEMHGEAPSFQASSIPGTSATSMTRRIREQGAEAFERMMKDMRTKVCYVNLIADSGTVLRFNAVHAMAVNPNFPANVLPLDTFENRNFTGDDYEAFFRNAIAELTTRGVEVVAVVCDNCPAQLNGVAQALLFFPDLGILHIPCFNHMVNLVFTHILELSTVADRIEILRAIIAEMLTDDGKTLLGRKCPNLVPTRWVYVVDVLRFIFDRIDDVNAVLIAHDLPIVPDELKELYWLLLPLKLFSLSMENRSRKLHEVLPLAKEVMREYQEIRVISIIASSSEDIEILDKLTAHFVARLRINAFEDTVTAWVLSIDGRERIRTKEARFNGEVEVHCRTDFAPIDCVTEMQAQFRDQLRPWEVFPAEPEGGWRSIDEVSESLQGRPPPCLDVMLTAQTDISVARATAVSIQRDLFQSFLNKQLSMTLSERFLEPLDEGAFHIALRKVKEMATTLGMDPERIEKRFRKWLFTNQVPDAPTIANLHWREVHAIGEKWHDLARIGVRYASLATSEADVERLLGEREDVQGAHGVNFGTQTLDARLALRYEARS